MSGLNEQAPDPLELLRASDRRPRIEVWRERLRGVSFDAFRSATTRVALSLLMAAFVVGIGWRLFVATEPPVEASIPLAQPIEATATATTEATEPVAAVPEVPEASASVVVHVAGAVNAPGIVVGDGSWRVDDALRAAGGPLASADLDRINLAALLTDGQRVFVPHIDEEIPAVLESDVGGGAAGEVDGVVVVDLNTSSAAELESLPGVGPATAAAISHREEFGAFATVDALVAVSGIGPATLDSLREHLRV